VRGSQLGDEAQGRGGKVGGKVLSSIDAATIQVTVIDAAIPGSSVVVPFGAWLPGSEHSSIESLLSDTAVESRRKRADGVLGRRVDRASGEDDNWIARVDRNLLIYLR
jgi:hypothetical protein